MMNDPINPDNNDIDSPQQGDLQLQEGKEVILGLSEKSSVLPDESSNARQNDDSLIQTSSQSPQPEKNYDNGKLESTKVTDKPMINLSPSTHTVDTSKYNLSTKQQKALSKLNKIRKHKHWYNFKLVIGTVLVFLLIFNSQFFISQIIYLFNKPSNNTTQTPSETPNTNPSTPVEPTEPPVQTQAEVVGPQNEIIIPKIGVTAPLVFIDTNNEIDVLRALRDGVVHYYGTAYPGEVGNSVFFGHSSNDWWEPGNYKFVFVLLEKLQPGDTYEIHYNSRKYVYSVTETKVVAPTDLSVLNQTTEPTSTLITCTPPGTSWRRFIVFAKQTSPVPNVTPVQPAQQTEQQAVNQSQSTTLPSAPPSIWEQIINFFKNLFGAEDNKSTEQPSQSSQNQHLPEVN